MVDRESWEPVVSGREALGDRVPGALGGSRLWTRPEHASALAELLGFVDAPRELCVEVGFDGGERLLDNAERWPDVGWLGLELRRHRVAAARALAPPNCLPVRIDARSAFANLLPAARLSAVYVLFPTPAVRRDHLLLTDAFFADVARCLAPEGRLYLVTDVPALAALVEEKLSAWPPGGARAARRHVLSPRAGLLSGVAAGLALSAQATRAPGATIV